MFKAGISIFLPTPMGGKDTQPVGNTVEHLGVILTELLYFRFLATHRVVKVSEIIETQLSGRPSK